MPNFGEFKGRVLRMLGDPGGNLFDAETLYDGAIAAHDAILPWMPNTSIVTITPVVDSTSYELPAGLYEVEAVRDTYSGIFLARAMLAPGNYRGESSSENDWIEYPKGYLSLAKPIDYALEAFCAVEWEKPGSPDEDAFDLLPPASVHQGMAFYAASVCLAGKLTTAANIGQYKTRPDVGDPEDNPMQRAALFFKNMFLEEMNRQPRRHGVSS